MCCQGEVSARRATSQLPNLSTALGGPFLVLQEPRSWGHGPPLSSPLEGQQDYYFSSAFKIHHVSLSFQCNSLLERELKAMSVRNACPRPTAMPQLAGGFMDFPADRDPCFVRLSSFSLNWNVSGLVQFWFLCTICLVLRLTEPAGIYRCVQVFSNLLKGFILHLPKSLD